MMLPLAQSAPDQRSLRVFGWLAVGLALAVMAGAGLVLIGWVRGVPVLGVLAGSRPTMMPNTAAALFLVGAAVLLRQVAPGSRAGRLVAQALTLLVALFAMEVLREHASGHGIGIGDWIAVAPPAYPGGVPGRPAASTAIALLLLSASLLSVDSQPRRLFRFSELCASSVLVITLLSLSAYLFGEPQNGGVVHIDGIRLLAMHTAVLFLLASLAALFLRPADGLMSVVTSRFLGGVVSRRLLLAATLIPIVAFIAEFMERAGAIDAAVSEGVVVVFSTTLAVAMTLVTSHSVNKLDEGREARAKELRLWKQLFDDARFGAYVADLDGKILFANAAFAEMHGLAVEECRNSTTFNIIAPNRRAGAAEHLRQLLGGAHLRFDSEDVRKDGSTFPVEIDATLVRNADGAPAYLMTSVQDITDRKRAEDQLRESEARFRQKLDGMLEGCRIIGRDWRYLYVNQAAAEQGQQPAESFIGRRVQDIYPDVESTEMFAVYQRSMEDRVPRQIEGSYTFPGNLKKWFVFSVQPVPEGLFILTIDITERKRAEAALQESESRLKRAQEIGRVGDWQIELATKRLSWSDEMYRIFGVSRQEFGHNYANFIACLHPDDRAAVAAAYDHSLSEGKDSYELEYRLIQESTGDIRSVRARFEHVRDASGQVIRSVGTVQDITDQKRIEQTLRDSEERFRLAFDDAPIGMTITGFDGRFQRVNNALCEILGYTREELLGRTFLSVTHPDDVETGRAAASRLVQGELRRHKQDKRYVRKDGTSVEATVEASVVRDREGKPLYFVSQIEDISERKRAERALQASEERLSLALAASGQGLWDWDIAADKAYLSRGYLRLLGSADETVTSAGTFFRNIVHPDDFAMVEKSMEEHLQGKTERSVIEYRMRTNSGDYLWIQGVGQVVARDDHGAPRRMTGVITDITARKEAEEALRVSERRFRELFDGASDAIFIADLEGRFTDVNPAACRMLDYARQELLGKTIVDIIPPEDIPRLAAARAQLLTPGQVERGEWTQLRKDGSPVAVEITSTILPDGRWQAFGRDISIRRRIERELRQSEERFRLTIDEAPIGMALVDLEGHFVRVNNALCEIVGYAAEELTGRTFQSITHPDDLDVDLALLDQLTRGEIPRYQLEKRYIRKNQTPVVIMLSVSLLRDRDGTPLYYITQIEDITQRKRAEEAVRLSEAKFSGIVSISADAIISIAEDQRITLFNAGAEKIFGYSRDEALGAPIEMLLPEIVREPHRGHVEAFAAGSSVTQHMGERLKRLLGRRKNGQEFPVEASSSRIEVGGEKILTVVLRDISESRRVELEQRVLAEAGAILTSLNPRETADAIAQVIVRELAEMCVVDVVDETGRFQRLTAIHADPAKAEACERLAHLPFDPARPHLASSAIKTRRVTAWSEAPPGFLEEVSQTSERLELLRQLQPNSGIAAPLLAHGALVGTLFFTSSQPGRYGPRDLALAEELARRVALAIENTRLFEHAQRATRARDEMLGIVAHDLRNPLAAIMLAGNVLEHQLSEKESPRGRASVANIQRSVLRAQRLILDLLDVTRMESGRLSVECHRLSSQQVAFDAVEGQQLLASSSALELRMDLASRLPEIWADRDRILQVMENLIGNAVKFTPAGGTVTVGAAPRGTEEVLFWVADTGSGIPEENQRHVFDRFWQARRAQRHGAGLGLPICKGIVEAHGGRIWVQSTPGRGTVFFFTIPVARAPEEQVREKPPENASARRG